MADKETNRKVAENEENIRGLDEEKKEERRYFFAGETFLRVLRVTLQYLLVAILAFFISYCVSQTSQKKMAESPHIADFDPEIRDHFVRRQPGSDWSMDEMLINTADEASQHIVRAKIVISHRENSPELAAELTRRRSEIHSEVRSIIGSKRYLDINTTSKQKALVREIKTRIQLIVGMPGIIDVFLKDFTVH